MEDFKGFYPAENYHQNFLALHPDQPYITVNDLRIVDYLKQMFSSFYRADLVLLKTGLSWPEVSDAARSDAEGVLVR
jgi:peptide-methionine (S)-S-oxide reductase